ncbi:hypothetical protein ACS0TY_002580 [Phlomoides rotata]
MVQVWSTRLNLYYYTRFLEISELPEWVFNAVHEYWHNNPHLKRGEELEIKFISVASEDTTNAIKYPSFHFMKLQRPDTKAITYIEEKETKPALMVNLTEDEISTRRVWGIWVSAVSDEISRSRQAQSLLGEINPVYRARARLTSYLDTPFVQIHVQVHHVI